MPTEPCKSHDTLDADQSKKKRSSEMSFEVAEWLEGERLEHERRMQEIGCIPNSKRTRRASRGTKQAACEHLKTPGELSGNHSNE